MKKVYTVAQFKIIDFLKKENFELSEFDVVALDVNTIKLVDKELNEATFKYDEVTKKVTWEFKE